jgi:hypothetical protein
MKRKLSVDTYARFFPEHQNHDAEVLGLRRSQSSANVIDVRPENLRTNRVPRHMSFSAIESVVLDWQHIETEPVTEEQEHQKVHQVLAREEANAYLIQEKAAKISYLERATIPFTERQVRDIDKLDQLSQTHQDELNELYYERLEEYQTQKATSTDILVDERQGLTEGLRRVEMLGAKLDYELNALNSRVEEVEDGVAEFERGVRNIEVRVDELVEENTHRESWLVSLMRFFLTGKA